MDNKKAYIIDDFSGGYCGNLPSTTLKSNQALSLDNIVLNIGGKGFRSRLGDTKLNSTELTGGLAVQGIGRLLQADQDEWLVAVSGTKIFQSSNISGTFTDITGAVVITSGASRKWDLFTFNDAIIGFGGLSSSPDAPLRWPGTGNAAALGGTPPSAYGGFSANNRVFAFRTAASPSSIYWSVIGNAEDWTGTGSGSAIVGSLNDNQRVTAAAVLNTNYALVFKEASTYQMIISTAPFPVYSLFKNVGCVGKHALVNVDGEIYFVTNDKEMVSTDGSVIKTYPKSANNLWNAITTGELPNIEGVRQRGADYDWIVWIVTISGAKVAIIWDLLNKCWLRCSSGYNMNLAYSDDLGRVYTGNSGGFIFKPAQAGTYTDASGGDITADWQSGFLNPSVIDEITQVQTLTATYATKASGSISFTYGYDFVGNTRSFTLSQVPTATEEFTSRRGNLTGRGNVFKYRVTYVSSAIDMNLQSLILRGKTYGQKRISAP